MLINEKTNFARKHFFFFFFAVWKKEIIKMNLLFSIYACVCMYVFGRVCECVTTIRSNPTLVIMRGEITLTMSMKIESQCQLRAPLFFVSTASHCRLFV